MKRFRKTIVLIVAAITSTLMAGNVDSITSFVPPTVEIFLDTISNIVETGVNETPLVPEYTGEEEAYLQRKLELQDSLAMEGVSQEDQDEILAIEKEKIINESSN